MKYQVVHTTRYRYSQPVTMCHNQLHLCPRDRPGQVRASNSLQIEPRPASHHDSIDYFGNHVAYFTVHEPHSTLTVTSISILQREPVYMPVLDRSLPWDQVAAHLRGTASDEAWAARELVLASPLVPLDDDLRRYALPSFAPGRPLLEAVSDLARRIHHDFIYAPQITTVTTPLAEVMEYRRGVCQDFAHLGIGCLRAMGLPARYVSGYIESLPAPGATRLQGADASHAWFAAFDPLLGWVDFDPTNNQFVAERHVTTAWGRDYSDVSPLKGVIFGGGTHVLDVEVDMLPLGSGRGV